MALILEWGEVVRLTLPIYKPLEYWKMIKKPGTKFEALSTRRAACIAADCPVLESKADVSITQMERMVVG